jgi:hypothetical protein
MLALRRAPGARGLSAVLDRRFAPFEAVRQCTHAGFSHLRGTVRARSRREAQLPALVVEPVEKPLGPDFEKAKRDFDRLHAYRYARDAMAFREIGCRDWAPNLLTCMNLASGHEQLSMRRRSRTSG